MHGEVREIEVTMICIIIMFMVNLGHFCRPFSPRGEHSLREVHCAAVLCVSAMLVLRIWSQGGWVFREVAALHSDHCRQPVPLSL